MAEYLHGAYGQINEVGVRETAKSQSAIVYIGTAPVALATDKTVKNVNEPLVISDMAEAKKYLGYSEDWAKYTLCEAMHVHFELNGVGPVIFINVAESGATETTAAQVIGTSDGEGTNTGIQAVQDVYYKTGYIPSILVAPGFSNTKEVNTALVTAAKKIGGHWDAYVFADMPTVDASAKPLTLKKAAEFKAANGYNAANEKVFFPLVVGTDDKVYHLSTLAAANFQQLLIDNDDIPYHTVSNTECAIIKNLRFAGDTDDSKIYTDGMINENLNQKGITSACYVGGRWVIWGPHSADFTNAPTDQASTFDTNRLMLYYLSNDFQERRAQDVDRPMSRNDLQSIVAEEQARLDALLSIGALIYGEVYVDAESLKTSDIVAGDFKFQFNVTTTPLAKSLTAVVNWTDDGFVTYFADEQEG